MKPVFIIAIVTVAMIGVMVPISHGQNYDVVMTLEPNLDEIYLNEVLLIDVTLSKVIPNTPLLFNLEMNNMPIGFFGGLNSDEAIEEIKKNGKYTFMLLRPQCDPTIESVTGPTMDGNYIYRYCLSSGEVTVTVTYGDIDDPFAIAKTTFYLNSELSDQSKKIQKFFPTKIDVGTFFKPHFGFYRYVDSNYTTIDEIHYRIDRTQNLPPELYEQGAIFVNISNNPNGFVENIPAKEIFTIKNFKCYGNPRDGNYVSSSVCSDGFYKVTVGSYFSNQGSLFLNTVIDNINPNYVSLLPSATNPIYSSQSEPVATITSNNECGEGTFLKNNMCVLEITCGEGTIEKNGQCVVDEKEGGGCLIATATYGSELAPQVQQLRELRDNQLLQTASGTQFMGMFNDVYYSFSPIIADYERENPYFKEAVKLAITPMISSLSLMENAESESEVLGIGISVIVLNLGMYLGIPAVVVVGIRRVHLLQSTL